MNFKKKNKEELLAIMKKCEKELKRRENGFTIYTSGDYVFIYTEKGSEVIWNFNKPLISNMHEFNLSIYYSLSEEERLSDEEIMDDGVEGSAIYFDASDRKFTTTLILYNSRSKVFKNQSLADQIANELNRVLTPQLLEDGKK